MDKNCLIIQPGAFGDIILCAPIAKIYSDNGYKVYWPITTKFLSTIQRFEYVTPIVLDDRNLDPDWLRSDVIKCLEYKYDIDFDIILNLADRGPHPMAEKPGENFELCKYRLSNIPIEYKHHLSWKRNIEKENALYDSLIKENKYILAHLESSRGDIANLPNHLSLPIVEVKPIDGFDIFDWFKIIINASEIYCVESSVHQFMDGILEHLQNTPKYLLSRSTLGNLKRYTYSPYWKNDYLK